MDFKIDGREGKGRRSYLGDVLECRTNQLAERVIWTNVFGRTSILDGWWFGMCETDDYRFFSKHPFRREPLFYSSFSSKSCWWKISSAARNWINPVPYTAATTFAFTSVFILLLCVTWLGERSCGLAVMHMHGVNSHCRHSLACIRHSVYFCLFPPIGSLLRVKGTVSWERQ